MATETPVPHVVIFPYMAQGHAMPLLELSIAMARRGVKITIITTPSNAPYINSKVSKHPRIFLSVVPFPQVDGLPEGCEHVASLPSPDLFGKFVLATQRLKEPVERVLEEMSESGSPPACVITDIFLPCTMDFCRSFGVPRITCHVGGVLPLAIHKALTMNGASRITAVLDDDDPITEFPEVKVPFTLTRSDLPGYKYHQHGNAESPFSQFLAEMNEAADSSWGYLFNSFEEFEGEYVSVLESTFLKATTAWCVGPLHLFNEAERDEPHCPPYIQWLSKRDVPNTVIYVAFGSSTQVSDAQLDEIAFGLEMSGHPFLWVIRATEWAPPSGWAERVRGRGLVLDDWVDQRDILAHPSTGGFLSHCGWNSVLEGLSRGVPLLAWPWGTDQFVDAKYVAEGLGAGILLPRIRAGKDIMTRDAICDGVRELMSGESGRKARERAQAFGAMAKQAVEKGGSSDKKLDELIDRLTRKEENNV